MRLYIASTPRTNLWARNLGLASRDLFRAISVPRGASPRQNNIRFGYALEVTHVQNASFTSDMPAGIEIGKQAAVVYGRVSVIQSREREGSWLRDELCNRKSNQRLTAAIVKILKRIRRVTLMTAHIAISAGKKRSGC